MADSVISSEDLISVNDEDGIPNSASSDKLQGDDVIVAVSKLSTDPHLAWRHLHSSLVINTIRSLHPSTPIRADAVRFVCISDTHSKLEKYTAKPDKHIKPIVVPDGDILLHAGDFTLQGLAGRILEFNTFLGTLPHRFKVVIAGNHELSFDESVYETVSGGHKSHNSSVLKEMKVDSVKDLLTNCIYLEDSSVELCGIKIYGSPWQPEFRQWAFNVPRGQPSLDIWNKIPSDTEILMTHGPPLGYGDCLNSGGRVGCVDLLNTVQKRVRPQYHVFGHIHEGYGVYSDGHTTYINASTCTTKYHPINPAILFDVPLKDGYTKDSVTFKL